MLGPAAGRTLLSKTSIGGASLATSSTNQTAKFDCDLIRPDPLMRQDDETVNKLCIELQGWSPRYTTIKSGFDWGHLDLPGSFWVNPELNPVVL